MKSIEKIGSSTETVAPNEAALTMELLTNEEIKTYVAAIFENMDDKGYYLLDDPSQMPKDARIEFIYEPTYLIMSIFAQLLPKGMLEKEEEEACKIHLIRFTETFGRYGIPGSGYDALEDKKRALCLMRENGLLEFVYHN